jgi:hypothetical protein
MGSGAHQAQRTEESAICIFVPFHETDRRSFGRCQGIPKCKKRMLPGTSIVHSEEDHKGGVYSRSQSYDKRYYVSILSDRGCYD